MNAKHIVAAYIDAALWSSNDEDDYPLDRKYGPHDLSPEACLAAFSDCEQFLVDVQHLNLDAWYPDQVGHDFWLTRNGHGAGFWARTTPQGKPMPHRDELTRIAHSYGECYLYTHTVLHFEP